MNKDTASADGRLKKWLSGFVKKIVFKLKKEDVVCAAWLVTSHPYFWGLLVAEVFCSLFGLVF